jgi:hypothetical protein
MNFTFHHTHNHPPHFALRLAQSENAKDGTAEETLLQAIFPPLFLLWRLSSHAQRYKKRLICIF